MVTGVVKLAVAVFASVPVIDAVAITDIMRIGCAISPNRELYEPRKIGRKGRVEPACIDLARDRPNNRGAAGRPVTGIAIRM